MIVEVKLSNSGQENKIVVNTNNNSKQISIPAKAEGNGSSVNGAELLFTALATCFCNDIYREAVRRKIEITSVEVNVNGEFGSEGEPARKISYRVKIGSPNQKSEIEKLIAHVDKIAEIHNTLRQGIDVTLTN